MSWFDGQIPLECRACFHFHNGKWSFIENTLCDDRCDDYLAMFPLIKEDGSIDPKTLDLLNTATSDPIWHIPSIEEHWQNSKHF